MLASMFSKALSLSAKSSFSPSAARRDAVWAVLWYTNLLNDKKAIGETWSQTYVLCISSILAWALLSSAAASSDARSEAQLFSNCWRSSFASFRYLLTVKVSR